MPSKTNPKPRHSGSENVQVRNCQSDHARRVSARQGHPGLHTNHHPIIACGSDNKVYAAGSQHYGQYGGHHMVHELRVLHCVTGRLPALLKRFETETLRLFEKHGIKQLGSWTVAIGESNNDLFLILQWESLTERELKFG